MYTRKKMLKYQKEVKRHLDDLLKSGVQVYQNFPTLKKLHRKSVLIVCTGYSGCGKTTFGKELEKKGFKIVNNDDIRLELFGKRIVDARSEAQVVKASLELMEWYLGFGYDVVVTNCTPTNFYRKLYLSPPCPVVRRILVRFRVPREVIEKRRGPGSYDFIDMIWEEPDMSAPYMEGVTYVEIDSSREELLEANVDLILGLLEMGNPVV